MGRQVLLGRYSRFGFEMVGAWWFYLLTCLGLGLVSHSLSVHEVASRRIKVGLGCCTSSA